MCLPFKGPSKGRHVCRWAGTGIIAFCLMSLGQVCGQTASTGALTGITLDPFGAALPVVTIDLIRKGGSETRSVLSDENGLFAFPLLPPGKYELHASRGNFRPMSLLELQISVTETLKLEILLQLAANYEQAKVISSLQMVQTETSALGRVVDERGVLSLPLVTRNFTQISGLSPGVVAGVFNSGELGLGGTALSQIAQSNDGIYAHGARSYDNNFELDGVSVSDVQGSSAGSGGIPIPNPDTIEEFKVQTGLYDASFGRYAGANISVITKIGTNSYHLTMFEFLRNDVLNANDFFLNRAGQTRPNLKQNQFGFALGGPIRGEKLFFFGSYQGTRQVNGIAAGQARVACAANLNSPPLADDRSPAALGRIFGGMSGKLGGIGIKADGSNINPVALTLLNFKLPDGSFLIPTPQSVDLSRPLASQGFSAFTQPCHFQEDQVSTNVDYLVSQKSKIALRFFTANDNETVTFPGNGLNASGNIPGFPSPSDSSFRVFSLAHTYTLGSQWLNEVRVGFVHTRTGTRAITPFKWSDVGVTEGEMSQNNELPSLNIAGSASLASGFPRTITQNSYVLSDILSFARGAHTLRIGGSLTRLHNNVDIAGLGAFLQFLSWPDFLLGLDGSGNGTGTFSNVFASFDDFGLSTRKFRVWEAAGFVQDDFRIRKSLTLNVGMRYEHLGQFGDELGRNSSFDVQKADPNPPSSGSTAGYIVASNFAGALPAGVLRADNNFGNDGTGQNALAARFGLAWQILRSKAPVVLRAGYGTFYSRPTGQAFYQSMFGAPFSQFRLNAGAANKDATFSEPFAQPFPTPASFPQFPRYSPTTNTTVYAVAPDFRPAMIQQFSVNVQSEIYSGWLLEAGYVGSRGIHLVRQRSLNQALSASENNPIRGETSNTLANISLRVPIPGIPPDSLQEMESAGSSWYNGLEVSLTKRLSHGLQFLASYSFSRVLDTDGADINSTSSGNALTLGDQNSPRQRWGRASFDRTHRFVFSATWDLPNPPVGLPRKMAGGWSLSAVATIQSGSALTISDTNPTNVFGISEDRAQLSGQCGNDHLVTGGNTGSKLNDYFNKVCFTSPPVIGADGVGTAFGNSGTGIADGPGQANLDLAISKAVTLTWPREGSALEVRGEFFNAFNHAQFANPDTNFTSPTFGVISKTSVNARVGQLAVRFSF
jgi:hypothetical protein